MEKHAPYFALSALYFCILTLNTYAQDVDFLSIDCGAVSEHTDDLKIDWVTDEGYIKSGKNMQLSVNEHPRYTLRYFPEGMSKNCYVLPVKSTTTYLLRARIYPGNATQDGGTELELPVSFDITVNNNLFWSYSATDESDRLSIVSEAIFHSFDTTEVYICLVLGSQGVPFINSIELREQHTTSYYSEAVDKENFMVLDSRYNTGVSITSTDIVRYPDDRYDRFWWPALITDFPLFSRVETNLPPDSFTSTPDLSYNWPPNKIQQDAWVGPDLSLLKNRVKTGERRIYTVFYFKEIRSKVISNLTDLELNPVGMIVGVNDNLGTINLTDQFSSQFWFGNNVVGDTTFDMVLLSESWSKHDAILNGYEQYYSSKINTSTTYSKDKTILKLLQRMFKLQAWTGDPCYPVAWDWLTCEHESSRIRTLQLSNMNISSTIPEEIRSLTELTEIHLDNNQLSGSIPVALTKLNKLRILALQNNNLSGEVPLEFQKRDGFTFSGNPGICLQGSTCNSTALPPAPPSAAVKGISKFDLKTSVILIVSMHILYSMW